MKVILTGSIVNNYLMLALTDQKRKDWVSRPLTEWNARCVVQRGLTLFGCITEGLGSSCAPPSPEQIVSHRWSSQCSYGHGIKICSSVTSRNDLRQGQLVASPTAPNLMQLLSEGHGWASPIHEIIKTTTNPLASAPAPDD